MDSRKAESIIRRYIGEYLPEPGRNWPKYHFMERSYARWAAYELIGRIRECREADPLETVRNFLETVSEFAASDHGNVLMFSAAQEVAVDILDILESAE